jgi:superfamily II DNA or RNA helicase
VVAGSPLAIGDVVRIRGQRWTVLHESTHGGVSILRVAGCERGNRGDRARFILPFERLERLPAIRQPRVVRTRRWVHLARHELAAALRRPDSLHAAAAAEIDLIPFQFAPALAVLRGISSRVLIADEVGLGKTIQAALIVAETLARTGGRALVICPAPVRDQWQQEVSGRFHLETTVIDAAALARGGARADANPWVSSPVVVTSYDYVKRPEVIRSLESIVWDVLVLDEAHWLSGRSNRAAAAAALAARARLVVMLSATPHSGEAEAFSRLCAVGRLPCDPPLLMFRRGRGSAGLRADRRVCRLRVRATAEERGLHQDLLAYARRVWRAGDAAGGARLAMTVLMKRACSSPASLARSVERRLVLLSAQPHATDTQIALPLEPGSGDEEPAAELAAPGLRDAVAEQRCLQTLLHRARLAAVHESKLAALQRLLRRCRESAIVFTEYRDTLATIASGLPQGRVVLLHGGLTAGERRDALREFRERAGCVLLATDTASEGLNLQRGCRLVVHVELPWTPLRLEQRVGRVDRIGQPRRVHTIQLIGAGTPEEAAVARLLAREAEAQSALAVRPRALTDEEIAAAVIGEPIPPPVPPAPSPERPAIITVDLDAAARQEASRLSMIRRLSAGRVGLPAGRPLVTFIRRRRTPPSGGVCFWLFRSSILDGASQIVWNEPIVVAAPASWPGTTRQEADEGGLPGRRPSAAWVRRLLTPDGRELRLAAEQAHARATAHCARVLERMRRRSLGRERDIATALERSRARLAVRQPGLFDRRAERVHAAQTVVLDRALDACRERMERLSTAARLEPGAQTLALGVALE